MAWSKSLKRKAEFSQPLKNLTTFRIGGAARSFYRPKSLSQLKQLVKYLRGREQKILVLGAGSNILVSDRGVDAAVIKLDAPAFGRIKKEGVFVEAGAGKALAQLIAYCRDKGLSGLEFMAGIPGTVGGALAMNAGIAYKGNNPAIGDLVESVKVLDYNSNLKILGRAKFKFGYRSSNLSRYIILSARLKLSPKNKRAVANDVSGFLRRRQAVQDYSRPNAGCVFKNPPGDSAGRLIDACGLKGCRAGGAAVSLRHANFILNADRARCQDVLALIRLIKKEVRNKYGVSLRTEIKIWK